MSPFLIGAMATAVSGFLAYGVYDRLLRPAAPISSRRKRGRQYAAAFVALVIFATLSRAIAIWDDSTLWIAVP